MKKRETLLAKAKMLFKSFALLLFSFLLFSYANASENKQKDLIKFSNKNKELGQVFETITSITNYKFFYETSEVDLKRRITISKDEISVDDLLKELFANSNLDYEILSRQIILKPRKVIEGGSEKIASGNVKAPIDQSILRGTVIDERGIPLPGASIIAMGTTVGTTTDFDGNFEITLPTGTTKIQISYLGYVSKEIVVTGLSSINVTLLEDAAALDEVVIVGYGSLAKKRVTGSVISVTPETIVEVPSLGPIAAIIGRVAGVQVQETSGEPGASPNIRIRGSGSISAGNDPLFVIDGIPISRNLATVGVNGGIPGRSSAFQTPPVNPLSTINPNDIESIQVLKDASAAAIYGSRGGNGVLLITTKKGSATDEGKFSFDSFFSMQNVANKLDLMNASELIDYTRDARNNNYLSSVNGASINDPIGPGQRRNANFEMPESFLNWDGTDTDWQDEMFKTGVVNNYNFSYASPLKNNTSFFTSVGYYSQTGIVEKAKFERYNLMLNVNSQLAEKLNLDLRIAPTITENQRVPASAPYFARPPGVIYSGIVHSPTVKPYNSDGSINQLNNQSFLGGATTSASNPRAIIEGVDDKIFQFQTRASLGLSYEILDGLTFKTFGGTYVNLYNQDFYRGNTLLFRDAKKGESYAQATSSTEVNWLWENTLNWEKEVGDHFVNAVAGYTAQKDNIVVKQVNADNYPDDLVKTISGGQVFAGNSVQEQWSLASSLFRFNYAFKDRYLFTGTFRSDRSSRFGADNQTGYFPSFSAGWRVNEEPFLKSVKAISELKLRFSWGETGNFEIPNYGAIGLLSPDNYNLGGNEVNGLIQSSIANPELTWEKSQQTNIGLELGLFKNRLFLLADYYNTKTSDLLLNVSISGVSGFQTTLQNLGEVQNSGFELALTSKNFVGAFSWDTDLNFSANKNEVLSLNEKNEPIFSVGSAGVRHVTRVGDPIGSYYGYVVDGIYQNQGEIDSAPKDTQAPKPAPGDFRFKDINGDGIITPDDRTVTGNYFPDFTWGVNNRFSYKNIDFSFLIQGVEGNEILNLTSRHMRNGEANFNSYATVNDRWRSASDSGNGIDPRADRGSGNHGNNNRPSSYQVEDGSFVRLRNVSLGYSVPAKKLFGNSGIDKLRFYVTGTNLITLTDYLGYNPEVSNISTNALTPGEDYGAYPLAKSFTLGINLTF
jgi:TonB-linked SusC/RagA family outer membrane protein